VSGSRLRSGRGFEARAGSSRLVWALRGQVRLVTGSFAAVLRSRDLAARARGSRLLAYWLAGRPMARAWEWASALRRETCWRCWVFGVVVIGAWRWCAGAGEGGENRGVVAGGGRGWQAARW